jgi:FlaA1/EpsC-like NDP-sugar epimerase
VILVMLQLQAVSRAACYPLRIVPIFVMAGDRFALPHLEGAPALQSARGAKCSVLIAGAGEAGRACPASSREAASGAWSTAGRRSPKHAALLRNVDVLGPIKDLPTWAAKFGVRKVIPALPSADHGVRRRVAELCAAHGPRR